MAIKRIIVRGTPVRHEDVAIAAITPGYLLEQLATGVQKHSGAGLNAEALFAVEREMTGDGIDVDYATADTVLLATCRQGDIVNAVLAASAAAIVEGDVLESDGDGTLRVATTDAATDDNQRNAAVAVAEESVDNSGGGTEVRILVRIA